MNVIKPGLLQTTQAHFHPFMVSERNYSEKLLLERKLVDELYLNLKLGLGLDKTQCGAANSPRTWIYLDLVLHHDPVCTSSRIILMAITEHCVKLERAQ